MYLWKQLKLKNENKGGTSCKDNVALSYEVIVTIRSCNSQQKFCELKPTKSVHVSSAQVDDVNNNSFRKSFIT